MTHRVQHVVFLALVALSLGLCLAAEIDQRIDALQEKFEHRYPELRELKKNGVIGETAEGFVAFVKGETAGAEEIVNEENADRRTLYALIAEKEQTTEQKVAERNARRNFRNAEPGDHLRDKDGRWSQKVED